ncbi:hypothetical protein B0A55_02341 [Friedmanniomyces simplex]|uniref:Uncharacterized protein n=1 Tax=Friedmanniomyces simplex TaxID=329884 RepID=A0A4U0XT66_9PEZI|nr:hypothetical protein B0A55_02341 [Friedmanniomyces simplex]
MAAQQGSTFIRAHMCGWRKTFAVDLSHNTLDSAGVEAAFHKKFGLDDGTYYYTLLWHFRDEPCHVQRPMWDLSVMAVSAPQVLVGESIRLHPHRRVQPVPVAQGTNVEQTTEDDGGTAPGGELAEPGGATSAPGGETTVPGGVMTDLDGETRAPGGEKMVSGEGSTSAPSDETASPGQVTTAFGGEAAVFSEERAVSDEEVTVSDEETTEPDGHMTALGGGAEAEVEDAASSVGAADQSSDHAASVNTSDTTAGSSSNDRSDSTSQGTAEDPDEASQPSEGSAPADEVIVQLRWSEDTRQQLHLTDLAGSSIRIGLDSSLTDLRAMIRDEIVQILQGTPDATHRFLNAVSTRFRTTVGVNAHSQHAVDLEDESYGGRLSAVSDLFIDPSTAHRSLMATINIHGDNSEAGRASKKRKTSKGAIPSLNLDQLVQNSHDDEKHDERDFVRVGEVSHRTRDNRDDIAEEYPMLAEIDTQQRTVVSLWGTRAWDFDDHCIGGFELWREKLKFGREYQWFDRFLEVRSKSELQKRVFASVKGDPRVPLSPALTFNAFDPGDFDPPLGTGAIDAKRGVVVVVRFVCHLPKGEAEKLMFHSNFQIVADDSDDFESVADEINAELETNGSTKPLFRAGLKERWRLHLWAMPHAPAPRKLFRFEPSDSSSPGLLKRFMSRQALKKAHPKLYMEAHIWPIDDENEQLAQHHGESIGSAWAHQSNTAEDSWLAGSAHTQRGSDRKSAPKKRKIRPRADTAVQDHARERLGSSDTDDNIENAVDQAGGSASTDEDLQMAEAREQSRLLFEDEQLRLAMETSEREGNPSVMCEKCGKESPATMLWCGTHFPRTKRLDEDERDEDVRDEDQRSDPEQTDREQSAGERSADEDGSSWLAQVPESAFTSAGTGIRHSEYNRNKKEDCHFLQIWAKPNIKGLTPTYKTRKFSDELKRDNLIRIMESVDRHSGKDAETEPIPLHSDVSMSASILSPGQKVTHELVAEGARNVYLHVVMTGKKQPKSGGARIKVQGVELGEGDGGFVGGHTLPNLESVHRDLPLFLMTMAAPQGSTFMRAHICGWRKTFAVDLSHNAPDSAGVETAFHKKFGLDDGTYHYTLLWHFRDEPCHVQRPMWDLSVMAPVPEPVPAVQSTTVEQTTEDDGGTAQGGELAEPGGATSAPGGETTVPGGVMTDLDGQTRAPGGEKMASGEGSTSKPSGGTTSPGQVKAASGGEAAVFGEEMAVSDEETVVSDEETTILDGHMTALRGGTEVENEDAASSVDAADQGSDHAASVNTSVTTANSRSHNRSDSTSQGTAEDPDEASQHKEGSAPADEVIVQLRWSEDTRQQLHLTDLAGSSIRIGLDSSLADLRAMIRDEIVQILQGKPDATHRFRNAVSLPYPTAVSVHAHGQHAVDLEDESYGGRLSAVSDLFVDPSTAHRSLMATITLLPDKPEAGQAFKKRKTSKSAIPSLNLDQLVQNSHDGEKHDERDFVRVGEVSHRTRDNRDDIAEEYPMLAEIDRQQRTVVSLWGTRAWDFDDHCLGGFELWREKLKFGREYQWFDGFLLPLNSQIVADDSDDFESVTDEINAELETNGGTKPLFRAEFEDRWQMQLWAMPHAPASRKMFRFEPSGSSSPSLLKRFVSRQALKKPHPKLYMEAHIWPVGNEDEQLAQHHGESKGHAGARHSNPAEDGWLAGSAPTQQGSDRRAATMKRKIRPGASTGDQDHVPERAGSFDTDEDIDNAVDQAGGSASTDEELQMAEAREQSRLLFENEQLRLAMEVSEREGDAGMMMREVLEQMPSDDALVWDAFLADDAVGYDQRSDFEQTDPEQSASERSAGEDGSSWLAHVPESLREEQKQR